MVFISMIDRGMKYNRWMNFKAGHTIENFSSVIVLQFVSSS